MKLKITFISLILFSVNSFSQTFDFYANGYSTARATTVVNDTLYSAVENGISRFVDGSWDELPDAFNTFQETYAIEVVNSNHIYLGSGPSTRFVKWDGTSWTNVGTLPTNNIRRILDIHYESDNEIYLISRLDNNDTYFYKYDGIDWINLNYPLNEDRIREMKYVSSNEIYLMDVIGKVRKYNGNTITLLTSEFNQPSSYTYTDNVFQVVDGKIYGSRPNRQLGVYDLATNTISNLGNLYTGGETEGDVDNVIVNNANDIYVNVVVFGSGFPQGNDFFISHWDGSSWTRIYEQFNDNDDSPQFFMYDNKNLYYKLNDGNKYYKYNTTSLSVEDLEFNNSFKIYPNPIKDVLHFDVDQLPNKVVFFDLVGKEVFSINNVTNKMIELPFKSGIYIAKFIFDKGLIERKIIIE